jgi:predicted ABC-type transport system involved in lysophospholipase L1 biosynthesis ATPase subunit
LKTIPDAALDDRLAFVGTSGSGKTYAAGTAVERIAELEADNAVLIAALDQLLDDMGDDGLSVCAAAKQMAIDAIGNRRLP